jgi:uncharacterized protein YjbI with pentapeptide repeats
MMAKPVIYHNAMYDLLRGENIEEFNQRKASGESTAGLLCGGDFRGLDLREIDADGLDLQDGYFRGADLRGVDLRNTNIEGASFCQAHISGCYFPKEVTAEEIRLSIEQGIRIRYRNS